MIRYDTVVIGAGLAGLTTACQLARANQKVLLVASGAGALLLSSGCIDVLGFQPADSMQPVKNPLSKLNDFLAEHPAHAYRFTGRENIEAGLEMFLQLVGYGSLDYRGTATRNWLLPSTAGALHPTCLAPASMVNGELSQGGRMLIVGFSQFRDFYPALISENLNEQKLGVRSASLIVDAPAPCADKRNVTPIELARAFEMPEFRRQVVRAVKNKSKGYSRIGFPAVLGIEQHMEVMADLKEQLGKTVFEISTLPPSVPGRRLFDVLRRVFLQAKGRLIIGSNVVGGSILNGRATQIQIETASRLKTIQAENFILATGGIFGGGIQTDADGRIWEPIFGLPIIACSDRHNWFAQSLLSPEGQPVAGYGIHINQKLNPVNGSSTPVAENLYIAGANIAESYWIRGRTGNGVALATAAAIVKQIRRD